MFVIEAVVEDMSIKKAVIAEVAQKCQKKCIIATNTSSLSVTEMAKSHPYPENFVGMHFFNPVHRMPFSGGSPWRTIFRRSGCYYFSSSKKKWVKRLLWSRIVLVF